MKLNEVTKENKDGVKRKRNKGRMKGYMKRGKEETARNKEERRRKLLILFITLSIPKLRGKLIKELIVYVSL